MEKHTKMIWRNSQEGGGGGQRNTQGKQKPPKGRTAKRCIGGKEKPTGVGGVRSREMHKFLYGKVRFFFLNHGKYH